ncbi:peptidase C15 [Oscillatoria sp. CS-180]|uniref:pyroglutamyl-peptidase I family protein n=1 Tax=Oscillatoria sp. CS-180 TaxID=3021720 RepID=UPI00232EC690|nr:peptidase C15 [Oscillatoria sp. CS-180]MDB9527828.1 peptidase C15 [Oscillatoria sp. CS-180]
MSLLLTSFAPWKAHQNSNASDDIVALLQSQRRLPKNTIVVRHLPVHSQLASCQVLSALLKHQPSAVVCCGMAEKRGLLNLEQCARSQSTVLKTPVDLSYLCSGTQWTTVSNDAGTYVCNDLYFQLLTYIETHHLSTNGLFIHVPLLNAYNREAIAYDLSLILSKLSQLRSQLVVAD